MARVQFGRGTSQFYANTDSEKKKNLVYFDKDTNEILVDGVAYGFSSSDSEILSKLKSKVETFFEGVNQDEKLIDTLEEIINLLQTGEGETAKDVLTLISEAKKAAEDAQADADALEIIVGEGISGTTLTDKLNAVEITANNAVKKVEESTTNGAIKVDGEDVKVFGLRSAAYAEASDFDAAGTAQDLIDDLNFNETVGETVQVTVVQQSGKITSISVNDSLAATSQSVKDEEERAEGQEDKIEASVGLADDGSYIKTSGNYSSSATTVMGAIAAVESQVTSDAQTITTINGEATVAGSFRKGDADTLEAAKTYAEDLLDWYEAE